MLLEARLLAARSEMSLARAKARRALALYEQWDDHRASGAVNFLSLLDVSSAADDPAD
jgi:hypothetical protein